MRQKLTIPLLIGGLVLLFVVVTLFAFSGHRHGDESANTTPTTAKTDPTADKPTGPAVNITNAEQFSTWINTNHFAATEEQLYTEVQKYSATPQSNYSATIRSGTFKTTYDESTDGSGTSIPTVTFVVDIPEAKQSYVVTQSGGDNYPYDILHISCPSQAQLKYGDFGCKNEEE